MRPTILILTAVSTAFALGGITCASAQNAADPLGTNLPAETLAIVNGVAIPHARLRAALGASGQSDAPRARQVFPPELTTRELLRPYAEKQNYAPAASVHPRATVS